MSLRLLALCLGALITFAGPAANAETYELRLAHFVTPKHSISIWLEKWAAELERKSDGALKITIFPAAQMGPTANHYDFVRTGRADIAWFAHGLTPGRFPLTDISNLPFLFGSAEVAAKVLNDPQLRSKYLDPEHDGVHVLFLMTHTPGNVMTAKKAVRSAEDMKGLRLRVASRTILEFANELGATPVGLPSTEMAEQMQKGTIDGVFTDYGGGGIAFGLGPITAYSTELYSYVATMGIAMNQRSHDRLPEQYKKMIDDSFRGVEAEIGNEWDKLDDIGKKIMVDAGTQPIVIAPEEKAKFIAAGGRVTERWLAELEGKGLPARDVYSAMKRLAEKHAATSRVFPEKK